MKTGKEKKIAMENAGEGEKETSPTTSRPLLQQDSR
jgi:hypothetical protein